jgi:hypothetical protein
MQARPLAVAACLLAACQDDPAPPEAGPVDAVRAIPEPPEASAPPAPEDPWQARLDGRQLAPSGLGPGSELLSFRSLDVITGDTVCPLEKAPESAKAKVIAVGTLGDEAFARDLQDLDAIVSKYEGALAAVAIITVIEDGRATTTRDPETARAEARDLMRTLDLTIPVVVPMDGQDDDEDTWTRYYNVTTSRTVMLADEENRVVFSKVEPKDWSELDAAFRGLLGQRTG